ncbi:MAG: AAA family ATPase [Candidatus Brockarchaeota archaeon]|nr:AAA family ATPase [Candidatus Brockarchaeota archaeon]
MDYVPAFLPHREAEMRQIEKVFSIVKRKADLVAPKVFITGDVGSGKTVLARRFGMNFEAELLESGIRASHVYVNCKFEGTPINVLTAMVKQLKDSSFPLRGFSIEEAVELFVRCLKDLDTFLVAVLDELDYIVKKYGSYLVYVLTRMQEKDTFAGRRLATVFIVRDISVLQTLDQSTLSTALSPVVALRRYTPSQLFDIISRRAELAFAENAVRPEALSLISNIAGRYGDARYAIELLSRAGTFADFEQAKCVEPEHVRQATNILPYSVSAEDLMFLNRHQRLILLSVARALQDGGDAYVSTMEIEKFYRMLCEEAGIGPRKHTQLWKYLRELSDLGFVSKQISEGGRRGRITLFGLAVSAQALRSKLESQGAAEAY